MQLDSSFGMIAVIQASLRMLCRTHGYMPLKDAEDILNALVWAAATQPLEAGCIADAAAKAFASDKVAAELPPWSAD